MTSTAQFRQRNRVCILGGTGFVGSHLAAHLDAAGYEVKILSRRPERHRQVQVIPTVSIKRANVHDAQVLAHHFSDCTTVVNLVGILNERGRDGSGFRKAHVELCRKVIEACRTSETPRLLHMSALKADPHNAPSHYLRSKGEAEQLVREANGDGIAATIFQPSVIFGPGDSFINRFAGLMKLPLPFIPLPRANARFAPVYVGDVAQAFVRTLKNPDTYGNTYQLCGPQVYSLRELLNMIGDHLGVDRRIVAMPNTLARIQALIGDFIPGKPFSTDNLQSLRINSICESDGLGILGIKPTPGEIIIPTYLNDPHQHDMHTYRRMR